MRGIWKTALLPAALGLLAAVPAPAGEGRIVYAEGTVIVESTGNTQPADIGTSVAAGDVVETGPRATAVIELDRGADLKLREDSRTRIGDEGSDADAELERGGLFVRVRRSMRGGFSANTETVVAGVRGTEFFLAFGRTVEQRPDVWLCVNEGEVQVEVPEHGEAETVRAGEGINILDGVQLTDARPYDWTRKLNWNMDSDRGEVSDDTDLDEAYADLLDQDYD
ncbi:MAG: FecR domain-containing protein [Spirochaetaceae bacterium]